MIYIGILHDILHTSYSGYPSKVYMPPQTLNEFNRNLLTWFRLYKLDMPWRGTTDPYRIWVSEIMLQQTQVSKVIGYYENFVNRFPENH